MDRREAITPSLTYVSRNIVSSGAQGSSSVGQKTNQDWGIMSTASPQADPVSSTKQKTKVTATPKGASVHQKITGHGLDFKMEPPMVRLAITPSSKLNSQKENALPHD